MKSVSSPLLSVASVLLILMALLGLLQRQGSDRLQVLPALVVGGGLVVSGAFGRIRRRKQLLLALRKNDQG